MEVSTRARRLARSCNLPANVNAVAVTIHAAERPEVSHRAFASGYSVVSESMHLRPSVALSRYLAEVIDRVRLAVVAAERAQINHCASTCGYAGIQKRVIHGEHRRTTAHDLTAGVKA